MSPLPTSTRRNSNSSSNISGGSNNNSTSEDYNIDLGSQEQVLPDATGPAIAGITNGTAIETGETRLFPSPARLSLAWCDIISSYLLLCDLRLQSPEKKKERIIERRRCTESGRLSIVKHVPIKSKKQLWAIKTGSERARVRLIKVKDFAA